jgi:hypothetical protein
MAKLLTVVEVCKSDEEAVESFGDRHDSYRLFGAVRASHRDIALAVLISHVDAPRVAAHFTVLDEAALHVSLDIDIDVLAAIWALDDELFVHGRWYAEGHQFPFSVLDCPA